MYHWTEYAQTNAQPRPLSDKKDFGICPLKPELEPWEVHTLGLHHPVFPFLNASLSHFVPAGQGPGLRESVPLQPRHRPRPRPLGAHPRAGRRRSCLWGTGQ